MSKYTTSPGNEAEMTEVEVEATNGMTPTVVTRNGVWMVNGTNPTAQGVGTTPTVSTEDTIRATNSTTPTASNSVAPTVSTVDTIRASNSMTPTVIENTSNVGPVAEVIGNNPTVSTVDTIVAGNSAVPTVVTSDDAVGGTPMVIAPDSDVGGTPTAQGVNGNPTVRGDERVRMVDGATPTATNDDVVCGTPTVIEIARGAWPTATVTSGGNTAQSMRMTVGTQGTGNVAESATAIVAEDRLAA